MEDKDCVFCNCILNNPELLVAENVFAAALRDGFPVSPGHTLIVPILHIPNFLNIGGPVLKSIYSLIPIVKAQLDEEYSPDGYNIGVNVGECAGQTVGHAHLHVIPRYRGDIPDPRGGVRWVVPAKADYWTGVKKKK